MDEDIQDLARRLKLEREYSFGFAEGYNYGYVKCKKDLEYTRIILDWDFNLHINTLGPGSRELERLAKDAKRIVDDCKTASVIKPWSFEMQDIAARILKECEKK